MPVPEGKIPDEKICPSCHKLTSSTEILCKECGKEVPPRRFEIVPEGRKYGILFKGKIRIHDLEMEEAEHLVAYMER